MFEAAKNLLGNVHLYTALQRVLGADKLRYRCIQAAGLRPGDCVLDVGCGPAYYFDRLGEVRYYGFDTSERYIAYARKRWGDRATFKCEVFTEEQAAELPPVDKILLFGLLHHLSDDECRSLLSLSAKVLAPNGVVISVDTCFEPGQGRISRWMSENDRGEYVRAPEAFAELARGSFGHVEGEVWNKVTHVPSSFWMMRMTA